MEQFTIGSFLLSTKARLLFGGIAATVIAHRRTRIY
jgi:hypothetical protein